MNSHKKVLIKISLVLALIKCSKKHHSFLTLKNGVTNKVSGKVQRLS